MTHVLARSRFFALPLLGLLLALGACQSEGPDIGVTTGDIESNPDQYFGQRVVVSGDIDDVYGSSFTIGGEGFQGELLVVVPSDAQVSGGRAGDQPYRDDDVVQVTGTVRQYVVTEIESEYGLDLVSEIEYEEQDPAIVAESIAITPREGGGSSAGASSGQRRDLSGQMRNAQGQGPAVSDFAMLVAAMPDLSQYQGRRLDLNSVPVQQVVSDSTFWVGSGEGERLFVFLNEQETPGTPTEGRFNINQGQTISLQGSLRRLPSMEQVSQRLDLDEQMQSMLQNQQYYLWAQRASGVSSNGGGSM